MIDANTIEIAVDHGDPRQCVKVTQYAPLLALHLPRTASYSRYDLLLSPVNLEMSGRVAEKKQEDGPLSSLVQK